MCKKSPSLGICRLVVTDKDDKPIQSQYHPGKYHRMKEFAAHQIIVVPFPDSQAVVVRKPISSASTREEDQKKPFVATMTGPFNPEGKKVMKVPSNLKGDIPG